jgi:hypothetical protein
MDLTNEISALIGQPESEQLEYKAVLPPARNIGQLITAFANKKGGVIILGVAESSGKTIINGLSEDFNANSVTHKALDLLSPKPVIHYQYVTHNDKRLYVIKIEKSDSIVSIEGKIYSRHGATVVLQNPTIKENKIDGLAIVSQLSERLESFRESSTGSKSKFNDHYQSVLNIIDDLKNILCPESVNIPTSNQEGKILIRILFSSCADNFETYLSELLYEIYLANPSTLKSNQQVSIKEVLDCSDMQEFVAFWSKKKLSKLQRGSVKGFISDNSQIKDLNVINKVEQDEIERILQIRHLYAHKNGIVDEKFLKFFPNHNQLNDEHKLTIAEVISFLDYLVKIVDNTDKAAIQKYQLATIDY